MPGKHGTLEEIKQSIRNDFGLKSLKDYSIDQQFLFSEMDNHPVYSELDIDELDGEIEKINNNIFDLSKDLEDYKNELKKELIDGKNISIENLSNKIKSKTSEIEDVEKQLETTFKNVEESLEAEGIDLPEGKNLAERIGNKKAKIVEDLYPSEDGADSVNSNKQRKFNNMCVDIGFEMIKGVSFEEAFNKHFKEGLKEGTDNFEKQVKDYVTLIDKDSIVQGSYSLKNKKETLLKEKKELEKDKENLEGRVIDDYDQELSIVFEKSSFAKAKNAEIEVQQSQANDIRAYKNMKIEGCDKQMSKLSELDKADAKKAYGDVCERYENLRFYQKIFAHIFKGESYGPAMILREKNAYEQVFKEHGWDQDNLDRFKNEYLTDKSNKQEEKSVEKDVEIQKEQVVDVTNLAEETDLDNTLFANKTQNKDLNKNIVNTKETNISQMKK